MTIIPLDCSPPAQSWGVKHSLGGQAAINNIYTIHLAGFSVNFIQLQTNNQYLDK